MLNFQKRELCTSAQFACSVSQSYHHQHGCSYPLIFFFFSFLQPERIQGKSYSVYSDIWSFGLTVLELAIGEFPYQMSMAAENAAAAAEGDGQGNEQLGFWELLDFIVEQPAPKPPPGRFSKEFASFCDAW
jgi:mitogen-activated protein kinase kinase 1